MTHSDASTPEQTSENEMPAGDVCQHLWSVRISDSGAPLWLYKKQQPTVERQYTESWKQHVDDANFTRLLSVLCRLNILNATVAAWKHNIFRLQAKKKKRAWGRAY